MPSCICGNFFSSTSYSDNKEDYLCPKCKDSSTPTSYSSSHEWVGENITGLLFENNNSSIGSSSNE